MINSFQPLNTITSGLILQQLEEEVDASNLAQPSVDSQGYLMNSLEQINTENNPSISFMGTNGLLSVGTGTSVESITSTRNTFLDSQIQQQSMTVGYDEILSNSTASGIMDQINSIVNGTTTLSSTLSSFTSAWSTLASNPTNVADQTAVVTAGANFANTANSEYSQLQNLQLSMNTQVGQTVTQINGLLQQLGSINQQLMSTQGSNQNGLLDARDYALDLLSRLVNYQVSYGTNGVANVWLNDISLVNGTNVSSLQSNISDINNPELMDITVQEDGGSYSHQTAGGPAISYDVSSLITGGNLGGELYARNVLLQSYKTQVDQIATSVMNVTNNLYEAGYVANTAVTGIPFFTGSSAASIQVNGVLNNDAENATSPFLATEVTPNSSSGQLAGFLGNLNSILANNYVQSTFAINKGGFTVNPTTSIASQLGNFATTPLGGTFTVNGIPITYTTGTAGNDTIDEILNQINTTVPNVYAVFNASTQEFYMYSSGNITIAESGGDNFTSWSKVENVLASTIQMNNQDITTNDDIVFGATSLSSALSAGVNQGPNAQAFLVTPSQSGSFILSVAGHPAQTINWTNSESLFQIKQAIQAAFPAGNPPAITVSFNTTTQQLQLTSTAPMSIYDTSGNFTVFTGLNGNLSLSNMASNLLSNVSTKDSALQTAYTTSSASLTQLNNEQANIAGVSTSSSQAGVPIATIEAKAEQSLITYNAMLQVMEVIDQMLSDLVSVSSTTSTNGNFQTQSSNS